MRIDDDGFEAGQPITIQGGNTGLVGGQIPQGEILLSTERLKAIREVDAFDDALIAEHHYLGSARLVGEHLKFLVLAHGRPIACFAWSSPPHKLRPRDRFIGWSREARDRNRHLIAYNPRFLIPPWVKVKHLASHLLGRAEFVPPLVQLRADLGQQASPILQAQPAAGAGPALLLEVLRLRLAARPFPKPPPEAHFPADAPITGAVGCHLEGRA